MRGEPAERPENEEMKPDEHSKRKNVIGEYRNAGEEETTEEEGSKIIL